MRKLYHYDVVHHVMSEAKLCDHWVMHFFIFAVLKMWSLVNCNLAMNTVKTTSLI
jgi:hypothetical protein